MENLDFGNINGHDLLLEDLNVILQRNSYIEIYNELYESWMKCGKILKLTSPIVRQHHAFMNSFFRRYVCPFTLPSSFFLSNFLLPFFYGPHSICTLAQFLLAFF